MMYYPKGGMCVACKKLHNNDCSKLDFKSMPPISRKKDDDGVVIVKCTEFVK